MYSHFLSGRSKRESISDFIPKHYCADGDCPPPRCEEICEYEKHEKCCNFPEIECKPDCRPVKMCMPTIICDPITKDGCTFVKETVFKKGYKKVKKIWEEKVWTDQWWCKKCEGEPYPSTNCNTPAHPTTTTVKPYGPDGPQPLRRLKKSNGK